MSGGAIQVTIPASEQARWGSLCREWSAQMRKSVPDTILWAGWKTAISARAHTRTCKAKGGLRDIIDNPALLNPPKGMRSMPPRYAIVRWRQGQIGPSYNQQTNDQTDPRRAIRTKGAARNTWNGVMRGLAKPSGSTAGPGMDAGDASVHLSGAVPYVELTNSLSYMPAIFPDAFPASFARVLKMIEGRLSIQARKALANGISKMGVA